MLFRSDFIVVAISKRNEQTNPIEFYNGLVNNKYEMNNYHDIICNIPNSNMKCGYILTLPVHNIYDIFLDVFPDVIFESKKYEMDNQNYESWNKTPINDIEF